MPLKSPEQALSRLLQSDPAVAIYVGTRIYPVIAPASAALPFITWRRSGVQRQQTLGGPMGMPDVLATIDIYGVTYEAVRDIADRVRACLDGCGGTLANSVLVENVTLENEVDGFAQLAGGDIPPVYSVTQTYSIIWQEK